MTSDMRRTWSATLFIAAVMLGVLAGLTAASIGWFAPLALIMTGVAASVVAVLVGPRPQRRAQRTRS